MSKPRSAVLDYLVYLAIRVVVALIQALPPAVAWDLAAALAWLAYRADRRHRLVATDNLRRAFPRISEPAIDRLVRAVYRHFCTMVAEMVLMPRKFHRNTMARYVRYADADDYGRVIGWLDSRRPLLVVTGHFGNWEMFSYLCGLAGYRGAVVARRIANPYLHAFLERFRLATGQVLLDKSADYERMKAILGSGRHLGMVGDQDAGPRGVFVDFFGRPASTHKSIALFALEYNAPILVFGASRKQEPLHYDLHLADVILPEAYANKPDAVRRITQRYTAAIESLARAHPEQYFWLHRRWKHEPTRRRAIPRAA